MKLDGESELENYIYLSIYIIMVLEPQTRTYRLI